MSDDKKEDLIEKELEDIDNINDDVVLEVKNEEEKKEEDESLEDKNTLESMGFPKELINRIYSVMHPSNLEEALDYLNKNDKDKFTHQYIANNLNVCAICGFGRSAHALDDLLNNIDNKEEEKEEEKEEKKNDILLGLDYTLLNKDNNEKDDKDNKDDENDSFDFSDEGKEVYTEDRDINNLLNKYRNKFNNDFYDNNDNKNNKNNNDYQSNKKKECSICMEEIPKEDMNKIYLPCKHFFCASCWKDYLKEKINNANVYKLKCMEHKCPHILKETFIKSILDKDIVLLEKYDKFLKRKKIMDSNKKFKFCPHPDCDGYAEKKSSKYVKCNNGHEFCFECLGEPHGLKRCAKIIDEGFEEWKSHTRVKRCPNCQFYTEKNEGCNHMTCSQCKFQWCWVCEKECVAGHYEFGPCRGLHFENVNNDEDAKRLLRENCDCCCIFGWLITKFIYLLIYLFMMPCFYLAVIGLRYLDEYDNCGSMFFYYSSFLPFFICYEVISVCYIVVISIPAIFICPLNRCLKNILFGKILGELFPV